jgi:TonB family protein
VQGTGDDEVLKLRVWCGCLILSVGVCSAGAQSIPTQQSIAAELQQPFLMLRGMYDGDKIAFDPHGELIGSATPMPFSLSFLVVQTVTVAPDKVEIDASRAGLEMTQRGPIGTFEKVKAVPIDKKGRFQVVITIRRDPQHDELLQAALNRVFHAGFNDSLIQVAPQYWRPWIAHELHPERPFPDIPAGAVSRPEWHVATPVMVHTVKAAETEAARIHGVQGRSVIGAVIDEAGVPRDMVIVRPVGMGLDEAAMLAVMQYRLTPAKRNGQPIPFWIDIEYAFGD